MHTSCYEIVAVTLALLRQIDFAMGFLDIPGSQILNIADSAGMTRLQVP